MGQYQREQYLAKKILEALKKSVALDPSATALPGSGTSQLISLRRSRPRPIRKVLFETYILAFIDRSGSMENEVPAIRGALAQVREFIRDRIYSGDQNKTNEFVLILNRSDERWLLWANSKIYFDPVERVAYFRFGNVAVTYSIAVDEPVSTSRTNAGDFVVPGVSNEQFTVPKKIIVLSYINESVPVYHGSAGAGAANPSSAFLADYQSFLAVWGERQFFKSVVYSVVPERLTASFDGFQEHLRNAIDGEAGYLNYPRKLNTLGFEYKLNVPSERPPETFFLDIQEILDAAT